MSAVIGVDLGGTNVRAGLVRDGKLVGLRAHAIRAQGTELQVFADLCAAIDAVATGRVNGIGVGVPSLVDPKTGVIFDTTNIPSWTRVPLRKKLEKKYGVPVRVDNDANCFALGEKHFGLGKRAEHFVGLSIGTGLGAGIVVRGQLCSGVFCGAGEVGMLPYRDGILENYASGQLFKRQGRDGAQLAEAAAAGDRDALALWDELGRHLAHGIKVILYTLAPELIVLGGSVSRSFVYFESALRRALDDFAFPGVRDRLAIKVSRVKHVAVLGAASLNRFG